MKKFIISLAALVAIATGLLLAQQGNQVIPAGGSGSFPPVGGAAPPSSDIFYATTACNGLANCVQWVDDDATDNCGTATTAWVAAINGYTGPGSVEVWILGSGSGKAFLLQSCHLVFGGTSSPVYMSFHVKATIDAGTNSNANLIQVGDGTHGYPEQFILNGGTYVGGASLTVAGVEFKSIGSNGAGGSYAVEHTSWINFGAGNATAGSCTNYAVQWDHFYQGYVNFNNWVSAYNGDTTNGRCGFNNAETTTGYGTLQIIGNTMQGSSTHCASVLLGDAGSYGMMAENNIGNASIPILLKGFGHRIVNNELDTEGCTPAAGNNAPIQVSGSSASPIPDVTVSGNTVQGGTGHAANFITTAPSVATSPFQSWTITNNTESVTSPGSTFSVVVNGSNTTCAQRVTSQGGCYMAGNIDMIENPSCGTFTGWQVGTNLASCAANTAGANIGSTLAFTQFNGTVANTPRVRVNCQIMLITAATTSSTLPQCEVQYTETNTGGSVTVIITPVWAATAQGCSGSTTNTVGNSCAGVVYINPKANTTVNFLTINYASVGGTAMVARAYVDAENAYAQ